MTDRNFNIRVYGLHINSKNEVLLSDEFRMGTRMTKFPGGGLEYGEGPEECLLREAVEEFGQEISIKSHFYTTHFFQPALYFKNTQLISIYYLFDFKQPINFELKNQAFDFKNEIEGEQSFRWRKINLLNENDLTFPIDKHVLKLLKEKYY